MPTRLASHYEELAQDDALKSLREGICILGAMVREKTSELGDDTGPQHWRQAMTAYRQLSEAKKKDDQKAQAFHFNELGRILSNGQQVQEKEAEICTLLQSVATLSNVEIKRLEKMQVFVTPQEIATIKAAIIKTLQKHVEPNILSKVSNELGALYHGGHARP